MIVEQSIRHVLVDLICTVYPSTHLKAKANKGKYDLEKIAKSRSDYCYDLDAAVYADSAAHDKKPMRPQERQSAVKDTEVSRNDPEIGYMVRDGKPKGFFYRDHSIVDSRHSIITDTFATPANVHDSIICLSRLDRQKTRFDFDVKAVGLDAGYATTDPLGYHHYKSDPEVCKTCPFLASCTTNKTCERTLTRQVWQEARDKVDAHRLTLWGKAIYKRRKETVERSLPMPRSCMAIAMRDFQVEQKSRSSA